MNPGSTRDCSRCGQSNPVYGLWCRQCGTPLSQPADPAPAAHQPDASLDAHVALYRRVLEDLNEIAARGEVPAATFSTIEAFYAARLAEKWSQVEVRQRAAALQKCVSTARTLAHAPRGQFEEAIHTLEEGLKEYPDEQALSEMVKEIRTHIEQQERVRLAARTAFTLLVAAKDCLRESRIEEAEGKLQSALALDPHNQETLATLAHVRRLLHEARRRPHLQEPATSVPEVAEVHSPEVVDSLTPALESGQAAPRGVVKVFVKSAVADRTPVAPSFVEEEIPSPTQRWIEAASEWSKILKPFLLDNVGWFIGVFLIIAGFVVLITTFWRNIEENRLLMLSFVYISLFATTAMVFALAYFLRVKHPELETSSNVLLIIVALLIPLVFAAAALTTLLPAA